MKLQEKHNFNWGNEVAVGLRLYCLKPFFHNFAFFYRSRTQSRNRSLHSGLGGAVNDHLGDTTRLSIAVLQRLCHPLHHLYRQTEAGRFHSAAGERVHGLREAGLEDGRVL